jgi:Leucine-rich repeat (LRR) protein
MHCTKIALELNNLKELPETMGRMRCHTLNVNKNQIERLPECLASMKHLKLLLCNFNNLRRWVK